MCCTNTCLRDGSCLKESVWKKVRQERQKENLITSVLLVPLEIMMLLQNFPLLISSMPKLALPVTANAYQASCHPHCKDLVWCVCVLINRICFFFFFFLLRSNCLSQVQYEWNERGKKQHSWHKNLRTIWFSSQNARHPSPGKFCFFLAAYRCLVFLHSG